jgi:hypothetical protein
MPRAGFESATPATKRPKTYALDRAATGIRLISSITKGNRSKWQTDTDLCRNVYYEPFLRIFP